MAVVHCFIRLCKHILIVTRHFCVRRSCLHCLCLQTEYASVFLPVVETGFGVLPKAPEQLIREGAGSGILAIRGSNKDEDIISYTSKNDKKNFNIFCDYFTII